MVNIEVFKKLIKTIDIIVNINNEIFLSSEQVLEYDNIIYSPDIKFSYNYSASTINFEGMHLDKFKQGMKIELAVVVVGESGKIEAVLPLLSGFISEIGYKNMQTSVKILTKLKYLWDKQINKKTITYKDFPSIEDIEGKKILWGKSS